MFTLKGITHPVSKVEHYGNYLTFVNYRILVRVLENVTCLVESKEHFMICLHKAAGNCGETLLFSIKIKINVISYNYFYKH